MEQSAEVKKNHQKSSLLIPSSKPPGSFIRIDSISINLAAAMDNPQDAGPCDHFSIRGYVAEMREKNINVCYPFSIDDNQKQNNSLPPLDVAKFKRWDCYNCLREIDAEYCAKEAEKVPVSSSTGSLPKGSCSIEEHLNGAAKGKGVIACTELNRNDCLVFPCNNEMKENNEVVKSIADGSEIGRLGTSNVPNVRRTEIGNCETRPEVAIVRSEDINGSKGKTSISRSVDDVLSSESRSKFATNLHHDKFEDSSSKTIRQRPLKVRLLTELLGSGGNAENDQSRTTDSVDSASDFCDDLTAQTILKWNLKGKRKIIQDENGKPPFLPKRPKLSKGKAKLAKRNCMVIDSETEESSGAFIQQKNPAGHVLSKKKQKQTQHEDGYPILMPRADVATKHHFSATDGGPLVPDHNMPSDIEIDPYDKRPIFPLQEERQFNMSKKKNKQIGTWGGIPVPPWSTMPAEDLCVRKDFEAYGRKGIGLSLNRYDNASRNEETHIAKTTIGTEPLALPWNSSVRESNSQGGDSSSVRKSAPGLGSEKGLQCDLNEKIASPPHVLDVQNANPRFQKGSIQHPLELIMPDTRNSDPKTKDQEKGNEDITMEIVELLAKNKYDRRQHEFERNYFSQERANGTRNFESMVSSSVDRSGYPKPYQIEDHSVRNPISQTTVIPTEYLAPINSFSNNNETRINLSKTEGKRSAFTRCNSFFDGQGTQSRRLNYPETGSIRSGNYQNYQWQSGYIGNSFSPPKFRYSAVPNYLNFPPSYPSQASNFGTSSGIPESSSRGNMAQSVDLNFVNHQYKNFQNQNRDIGFESFQNSSIPFASKHRGFDLNATASGSLDLQSNEAIPAMQLLSLMDPGLKSNNILNCDGNDKMISKPLPTRHPKEQFRRAFMMPSNSSRPPSSSYGENLWRDNSCVSPPPLSAFGPFSSPFPNGSNFQGANGIPTGAPLKFREKKKGPALNSACKMQKSVYITSASQNNQGSSSHRGPQYMSRSALPTQGLRGGEFCDMSRNPAEFSIPERGNIYMIDGKDLKFEKKSSLRGKKSSANVDGRKREGVAASTATNTQ